ncbi:MAG: aldehyde dehydrogenase family protein, partial [Opitutaceae bacterium]
MAFVSTDPTTGRRIRAYPAAAGAEIERALARARGAQRLWRERTPTERARHLVPLARAFRRHARELADLAVCEMGKPIVQARAEVEKCALACEYYARRAPGFLEEE